MTSLGNYREMVTCFVSTGIQGKVENPIFSEFIIEIVTDKHGSTYQGLQEN